MNCTWQDKFMKPNFIVISTCLVMNYCSMLVSNDVLIRLNCFSLMMDAPSM